VWGSGTLDKNTIKALIALRILVYLLKKINPRDNADMSNDKEKDISRLKLMVYASVNLRLLR